MQRVARARREALEHAPTFLRVALQGVLGELVDVAAAVAQRRRLQSQYAQAVVKVSAETAARDGTVEVVVGGGDDPHVDPDLLVAAEALDAPLLQEPQQRGLAFHRQITDFVEEQRAAVSHLDTTELACLRAGKGASLVAEQL